VPASWIMLLPPDESRQSVARSRTLIGCRDRNARPRVLKCRIAFGHCSPRHRSRLAAAPACHKQSQTSTITCSIYNEIRTNVLTHFSTSKPTRHFIVFLKLLLSPTSKKLSYRRRTARRTVLVNSCYVSRRTAIRTANVTFKVIQGH